MDSQDKKLSSAEGTGSIAVTKPLMAVLTPDMPAVSAFGMLSQEFSSRIMDKAKTAVGGYGMYSLDFRSEEGGERSTVFSPVFSLDMSVLLGKLEQLKTETDRETREHTERIIERVVELRLEREKAKLPTPQKSQNRDTAEKPQIKSEKPEEQPKSAEKKEKPAVTGREKQPAAFYQITQNFYSGLLPSRDAAARKRSTADYTAADETAARSVLSHGLYVREKMTERPPEMLFSKVLGGLQRLELTYASEAEEIPDGPVPRDSFLKQVSEKYKKESYIPDFVLAEIKASGSKAKAFGAVGTEQGSEYIEPEKTEKEAAQRLLAATEKEAARSAAKQEAELLGLALEYAEAGNSSADAARAPVPQLESLDDESFPAKQTLIKRETARDVRQERLIEESLTITSQDGEIRREIEKTFIRSESAEKPERIIYRDAETGKQSGTDALPQPENVYVQERLEYQAPDTAEAPQKARQIGVLQHFQKNTSPIKASDAQTQELRAEYAVPAELENMQAETANKPAAPVIKAAEAKRAQTQTEKTAVPETAGAETFLRQEAGESEYIKSLPDWTRDFLKKGYEPVPTVLNTGAPDMAEAGQTIAERGETAQAPAAQARKSLPAQEEEQIVWTNPTLAPPPKNPTPPQELSLKQPESSETQEAYISDAEIKRAADKVYKIIEDRLRKEKRRLGL